MNKQEIELEKVTKNELKSEVLKNHHFQLNGGFIDKKPIRSKGRDFTLKYYYLKLTTKDITKYKRVILSPFYCISNWGLSEPKRENFLTLLESNLNRKYKDISLEDYNHSKKFEKNYKKESSLAILKKQNYKSNLSWGKFIEMTLKDSCYYCGITTKQIYKLSDLKNDTKIEKDYSMKIEKKDNLVNYNDNNCISCCYWCKNAKTDEFSELEFREIAKGINKIWNNRLKDETIPFPK